MQATIINRAVAEIRECHEDQNAQLAVDKAHNAQVVAEHKAETGATTAAERIAQAASDNTARTQEKAKAAAKADRGISASAASNALADLTE